MICSILDENPVNNINAISRRQLCDVTTSGTVWTKFVFMRDVHVHTRTAKPRVNDCSRRFVIYANFRRTYRFYLRIQEIFAFKKGNILDIWHEKTYRLLVSIN